MRIDKGIPNRPVIVTTSLALVIITTIFLGSTVATVQKVLFGKEQDAKKLADLQAHGHGGHDADASEHKIMMHPNEEMS